MNSFGHISLMFYAALSIRIWKFQGTESAFNRVELLDGADGSRLTPLGAIDDTAESAGLPVVGYFEIGSPIACGWKRSGSSGSGRAIAPELRDGFGLSGARTGAEGSGGARNPPPSGSTLYLRPSSLMPPIR